MAASLPGALGTAEAGRLDSRVTLLPALGVSGLPAPRPQLGTGSRAPLLPFPRFRPLPSGSLSTHFTHIVWGSPHPGVLGRGTSVLSCMFTRLWMEGERQRQLFAPPSPQVPVLCPESADSHFSWRGLAQLEPGGGSGEPPRPVTPKVLGQHQGQKLDWVQDCRAFNVRLGGNPHTGDIWLPCLFIVHLPAAAQVLELFLSKWRRSDLSGLTLYSPDAAFWVSSTLTPP